MDELFDRTAVTIYHCEKGKTTPDNNVMVLLQALQRELLLREEYSSDEELQQWIDALLERGSKAILETPFGPVTPIKEDSSWENIVHLATEHGGMIIQGASGERLAYVVPNTRDGLLRWARNILERSTTG